MSSANPQESDKAPEQTEAPQPIQQTPAQAQPQPQQPVQPQQQQQQQGGWWGYMGTAWNSIQQTAQDFTASICSENEETITKVKEKIEQAEIKEKLSSGVSTVGTLINATVHKIEDKIQQEKHSSRPFWFKKSGADGNEFDAEFDSENTQPIAPKPFEKERNTYAMSLADSPQHQAKFAAFLQQNEEKKIDDAALCLEGRKLMIRNQAIATWFQTLVPQNVDEVTFWQRYFYWREITEKREKLISRHTSESNESDPKEAQTAPNTASQPQATPKSASNANDANGAESDANSPNASKSVSVGSDGTSASNVSSGSNGEGAARTAKHAKKKASGFSIIGKKVRKSEASLGTPGTQGKKQSSALTRNSANSANSANTANTLNATNTLNSASTMSTMSTMTSMSSVGSVATEGTDVTDGMNGMNGMDSRDELIEATIALSRESTNQGGAQSTDGKKNEEDVNEKQKENAKEKSESGSKGVDEIQDVADTDDEIRTNRTFSSGEDENVSNGHFSETSWQNINENENNNDVSPPKNEMNEIDEAPVNPVDAVTGNADNDDWGAWE